MAMQFGRFRPAVGAATPKFAAAAQAEGVAAANAKAQANALRSGNMMGAASLYNAGMGDRSPIADELFGPESYESGSEGVNVYDGMAGETEGLDMTGGGEASQSSIGGGAGPEAGYGEAYSAAPATEVGGAVATPVPEVGSGIVTPLAETGATDALATTGADAALTTGAEALATDAATTAAIEGGLVEGGAGVLGGAGGSALMASMPYLAAALAAGKMLDL